MFTPLSVSFFRQVSDDAAGVAALEMAFRNVRPSRLTKFHQQKIFDTLKYPDPHAPGRFQVGTEDLVKTAQQRGLAAGWGRVSTRPETMLKQIRYFTDTLMMPLIAVQRLSDERPQASHYRVIIGAGKDEVVFHDPLTGAGQRRPLDSFHDDWRPTGANVTGGVAIWVADRDTEVPLAPDKPNEWWPLFRD